VDKREQSDAGPVWDRPWSSICPASFAKYPSKLLSTQPAAYRRKIHTGHCLATLLYNVFL